MLSMTAKLGRLPRDERMFLRMVAAALIAHAVAFWIAYLAPDAKPLPLHEHVLQFRIGDADIAPAPKKNIPVQTIAAEPEKPAKKQLSTPKKPVASPRDAQVSAPIAKVSGEDAAAMKQKRVRVESPVAPTAPVSNEPAKTETSQRRMPSENAASLAETSKQKRSGILPTLEDLFGQVDEGESTEAGPSIGDLTQINSNAAARGESPQAREARARYEQQISGWVARHRFYPPQAGGKQGRAVVRVRIDRQGNVRYYGIEETSGLVLFDRAAIDMIRRANPMPSVPMEYPAGNLIEFLIPITFKP